LGNFAHICATGSNTQQPRQMLFTLRSMTRFSAAIAASVSPALLGPVTVDPADPEPVVIPGREFADDPDDCAVPALLVPGEGATRLEEFPVRLASLSELLRPPALPGLDGTPLPADPALGLPTALGLPAEAPLLAAPALAPPLPPELPLPPPAPPLWAKAAVEHARTRTATKLPCNDLGIG
jgi:hypothetical protein